MPSLACFSLNSMNLSKSILSLKRMQPIKSMYSLTGHVKATILNIKLRSLKIGLDGKM